MSTAAHLQHLENITSLIWNYHFYQQKKHSAGSDRQRVRRSVYLLQPGGELILKGGSTALPFFEDTRM